MKKKIEKDSNETLHGKLTLKVKLRHFLTPPNYTNYTNSQNSKISFGNIDFETNFFPILYPPA